MFKFRFGGQGDSSPTPPPTTIDTVRRRARHRLLGATVLVLAGVVGFPLLFESQPRTVPVNFEIDIPTRQATRSSSQPGAIESPPVSIAGLDESEEFVPVTPVLKGAPAASVAPAAPVAPVARVAPAPAVTPVAPAVAVAPAAPAVAVAKAPVERTPVTPPVPLHPVVKPVPPAPVAPAAPATPALPVVKSKPVAEPRSAAEPPARKTVEPKPVEKPVDKPVKPSGEAARAQALLEGKSVPAASAASDKASAKSRHVVQVGAFVDPNLAQEARAKLERSGLTSYTQISNTPDGPRTRVRLGPFATRAEADKAAAKAKALGLSAAILAL